MKIPFRKFKNQDEYQESYWLSVGDLMSCLLLVFILLFAWSSYNTKENDREQKKNDKKKIDKLKKQNKKLKKDVKTSLKENQDLKLHKFILENKVKKQSKEIEKFTGNTLNKKDELDKEKIKAEKERIQLNAEREKTDKELKEIFPGVKKQGGSYVLDIDADTLFEFGKADLKKEHKEKLKKNFFKFFESDYLKRIQFITVYGHTDMKWKDVEPESHESFSKNLDLSSKRAGEVVSFLVKEIENYEKKNKRIKNDPNLRKKIRCKFKAIGRSFLDYKKFKDNKPENDKKNRRVEVKLDFKENKIEESKSGEKYCP